MKKIALIGIGKMGLSHLAIANNTPGLEVVAICDTSRNFLRFIRRNIKINTYKQYDKMIEDIDLDGVLICTPNSSHFPITKYCIEHGLNVFIEKPLTTNYTDSKTLIDLADNNNVKGQVGYVNRFNPIFNYLKNLIDQNVIGEITNYNNQMIGGVILKKHTKGWRNNYLKGGGCLYDYGPHCFDLSIYLFGQNVSIQSSTLKKVYSTNIDDIVEATFLHDNKITGTNYINWSKSGERKANNIIKIEGTEGSITANKQEIIIDLKKDQPKLKLSKGRNQIYITDLNTEVNYYLRGEDFSRQMEEFSNLVNNKINESISSLTSASITDKCIEHIFNQSELI